MKVNVSEALKHLNGEILMDNDGKGNAVEATIKVAMVNALFSPVQKESGMDKVKKYELAKRIHNADGEVDLTIEEVALIKERIGEVYGTIVVGQIWGILDRS